MPIGDLIMHRGINHSRENKLTYLVAAVNCDIRDIASMGANGNIIVANQSDNRDYESYRSAEQTIEILNTRTRGVGINRNIALLLCNSEFALFADDDMRYFPETETIVNEAFEAVPDADILVFNLQYTGGSKENKRRFNTEIKRLRFYNILNYGAPRVAIRLQSQRHANLWFNTEFGGGTKYGAGEDVLFLVGALRNNLKIYSYPKVIGINDLSESSWFEGYTEKFFYDKGALFRAAFKKTWLLMAVQFIVRHNETLDLLTRRQAFKMMLHGGKGYLEGKSFSDYNTDSRAGS